MFMVRRVDIRPVSSIVFFHGGGDFVVPAESFEPKLSLVAASSSCFIVGLFPEIDGPTELTIGHAHEVDPGYPPSFTGSIEAPGRRILIDQVDEFVVHDQSVDEMSVVINIWLSHPQWPEKVFIGID